MASFEIHMTGGIDQLLLYIDQAVLNGSVSASLEGGSDMRCGDVRCVTRVYERYSMWGGNRLSLSVTVFGREEDFQLSAVTSGGSQAMFFKINTWGEEAFLDKFKAQIEDYVSGRR